MKKIFCLIFCLLFLASCVVIRFKLHAYASAEENYGYRYKIILPQEDKSEKVVYANKWHLKYGDILEFVYNEEYQGKPYQHEYEPKGNDRGPLMVIVGKGMNFDSLGKQYVFEDEEFLFRSPSPNHPVKIYDFEKRRILYIHTYSPDFHSWGSGEFEEEKK